MLDVKDPDHQRCVTARSTLPDAPLITTWPCLTEAMHLLGRQGGWKLQNRLWTMVAQGFLDITVPAPGEYLRVNRLMRRYMDVPMDLADASLVTTAERLGLTRIFTLDRHFYAYRIDGTGSFEVIPG
jgi:hypothetical protein